MRTARSTLARLLCIGLSVVTLAPDTPACTIFVKSDGQRVLVGNNEDNSPGTPIHLWFRAAKNGQHGYVLWGAEEQFPEGGLNDQGVFFDAAALPRKLPIRKKPGLPDLDGYAVQPVLSRSATVQQALDLLAGYNLVEQEKAQIFLADATGDYAVVHANYVVRKKPAEPSFVLTNYALQDDPQANPVCWRRRTVQQEIADAPATLDVVSRALQDSAQRDANNATIYSDAIDLKTREFLLYVHQDYAHPVRISLAAELRKGDHDLPMQSLLPPTLADRVVEAGLASALQDRSLLARSSPQDFHQTAYNLANTGDFTGALRIIKAEQARYGDTAQLQADRATLKLAQGDASDAVRLFRTALHTDPAEPQAMLMGASDGLVHFRVRGFPNADHVSIVGDFNKFALDALVLQRKDDLWSGDLKLQPGRYAYLVYVDGTWQSDPGNGLLIRRNNAWMSLLIVPGLK